MVHPDMLKTFILLINDCNANGLSGRFEGVLFVYFCAHLRKRPIAWVVYIAAAFASVLGFDIGLDLTARSKYGVPLVGFSVVLMYLMIPVYLKINGTYAPESSKWREHKLLWWFLYSIGYICVFCSVIGISIIRRYPIDGISLLVPIAAAFYVIYRVDHRIKQRTSDSK